MRCDPFSLSTLSHKKSVINFSRALHPCHHARINKNSCLLSSFTAGPPKALDEDETEFLDKLETVRLFVLRSLPISIFFSFLLILLLIDMQSKREYERQMADAEEQELRSFQVIILLFQIKWTFYVTWFLFQIFDILYARVKFMTSLESIVC